MNFEEETFSEFTAFHLDAPRDEITTQMSTDSMGIYHRSQRKRENSSPTSAIYGSATTALGGCSFR
jgi:hypothetical protein